MSTFGYCGQRGVTFTFTARLGVRTHALAGVGGAPLIPDG
jgi:hypothetical protein